MAEGIDTNRGLTHFILCSVLGPVAWGAQTTKMSDVDRVISAYVLPAEELAIEFVGTPPLKVDASNGGLRQLDPARWIWKAPATVGTYPIRVSRPGKVVSTVQVFVMTPFSHLKGGKVNGYRIGAYPKAAKYPPPRGFVQVTAENQDTLVSNSFRLKQFLCKQVGGYPKYLVLDPKLLSKLEGMLSLARLEGKSWGTFHVMSGYRTPFYNRSIKNVKYSRHIYGQAADIFVDENPANTWMDDLNSDKKISYLDAFVLFDYAMGLVKGDKTMKGGLGVYKSKSHRGPFLHVDVRGYPARWGVPRATVSALR